MFGSRNNTAGMSNGAKSVAGGLIVTLIQTMLTRRVAGRAVGLATRGAGGIPGLLLWMGVSYALNKYLNRGQAGGQSGRTVQTPSRRPQYAGR